MENLNNDNFFNRMQTEYPDGFILFVKWLESDKARLDWGVYFTHYDNCGGEETFELEDLPFELQFGILYKLIHQIYPRVSVCFEPDDLKRHLESVFNKMSRKPQTNE